MKKIVSLILSVMLLCGVFALTACGGGEQLPAGAYTEESLKADFLSKADEVTVSATGVTFEDESTAATVTVSKNPAKVMNLYASFTTLWYEAGGSADWVIGGDSATALYEEQIGRDITADEGTEVIATTSSGRNWNTELIVSKQPNLIICSTAMSGYATIKDPAAAAGIPVIAMSYDDIHDYFKWFKVFCNITGNEELWESVAMDTLDKVVGILMKAPMENNPKIFSMFTSSGTSMEANLSGTVVGNMAKYLRATNIADGWWNEAQDIRLPINLESVYQAQPEYILIQCHAEKETVETNIAAVYGDNAVWNALDAVKNDKIFYLQKSLFHNKPNRKFAEAYKIMAEILYPDIDFGA